MATYAKINQWPLYLHTSPMDFDTDVFTMALSNTAPGSETPDPTGDTGGDLADVTEIAYTNLSSRVITVSTAQASGTFTLDATDATLSASGGAVATWRYLYLYNETATSPVADPLISNWDHGSAITLADGDSADLAFNASGIYTIA